MTKHRFSLFKRMNSNGTLINSYNIASYHHEDSITWRWVLSYSLRKAGKTGVYFLRTYRGRGFNFHAGINIPVLGSLSLQTQPHMWNPQ